MSPLPINAALWIAWATYWIGAAFFVARTKLAQTQMQRLGHLVPLVVGFFLLFHNPHWSILPWQAHEPRPVRWIGDAITAVGLLIAVWARVHLGRYWSGSVTLKLDHRLIRSGPFGWTRHPIYTGMLVAALGTTITAGTADGVVGLLIILVSLVLKLRREETLLTGEFGDEYRQFQREVPALVPFT